MKKYIILMITILMCVIAAACAGNAPSAEETANETAEAGTGIGSFTSVDMDGNEVSEDVFGSKDVTILNVWATFCGPCIAEMPELAELAEELPGNAQVIGVVIDAPPAGTGDSAASNAWGGDEGNIELAEEILEESGVKYTNILASESVSSAFSGVDAVPTTFIVDKSGNMVCEPFLGADVEGYKRAAEEYLAGLQ